MTNRAPIAMRALSALALAATVAGCGGGGSHPRAAVSHRSHERRARRGARVERLLLGRSVHGRPVEAIHIHSEGARRTVLVVGCVHGNEPAGIEVARRLERSRGAGLDLWIVPDLNPDGVAAGTRQNADRVDLNRNFPEHWRPLGRPGDQQYSGPRPLSEPEARIAYDLIRRVRPAIAIWFHQPLGVVDESGGDPAVERRFASLSGLPLRRLTRYPGSAVGWQDASIRGTTAFVVELPAGRLTAADAARYARAVRDLARSR